MKIKVSVATNKVGSKTTDTIEIDDAEWSGMDDQERENFALDTMYTMIDWNWEEVV